VVRSSIFFNYLQSTEMIDCQNTCETLGCTTTSKEIILGLCAMEDGIHQLEFEWLGVINMVGIPGVKGLPFTFKNPFNENGKVRLRIYQPTLGMYHDCDSNYCFDLFIQPGVVHSTKNPIFEVLFGTCEKVTINNTRYSAIKAGGGNSPITVKICN